MMFESADVVYHICDHSNSVYLPCFPKNKCGITCHDVLAIRGALGYADAYCDSSRFGTILQRWILKNLHRANNIACVSKFTLTQLLVLSPGLPQKQTWIVIHNALNDNFSPETGPEVGVLLQRAGYHNSSPFIMHVGSALIRKNRRLLIQMLNILGSEFTGNVCFLGVAIDREMVALSEALGLKDRIFSIVKPDHETLRAFYNTASAFIFPSFSEGFGWPIVEAQACGAPVITSNLEPMREVSGGAALFADPTDARSFAAAFICLKDESTKNNLINGGFENVKRYNLKGMTKAYLNLYGLAAIE